MINGKWLQTLSFKGQTWGKSLRVIVLMREHFLSRLLPGEACTGELISSSESGEAARAAGLVRGQLHVCESVFTSIYPPLPTPSTLSVCVPASFIRAWSKCLQMQLPFAPPSIKEHSRMPVPPSPALQAAYLCVTGLSGGYTLCSTPVAAKSHKGQIYTLTAVFRSCDVH